jgi:restriction endonuclease
MPSRMRQEVISRRCITELRGRGYVVKNGDRFTGSVAKSEHVPNLIERLFVTLQLKMGYVGARTDAGRAIGKSRDGCIDAIDEDRLGLEIIYIQAKRWEGNVGRPEIEKFCRRSALRKEPPCRQSSRLQ